MSDADNQKIIRARLGEFAAAHTRAATLRVEPDEVFAALFADLVVMTKADYEFDLAAMSNWQRSATAQLDAVVAQITTWLNSDIAVEREMATLLVGRLNDAANLQQPMR